MHNRYIRYKNLPNSLAPFLHENEFSIPVACGIAACWNITWGIKIWNEMQITCNHPKTIFDGKNHTTATPKYEKYALHKLYLEPSSIT